MFLYFPLSKKTSMQEDEKTIERAGQLHEQGFNCCESVLRALAEAIEKNPGEDAFKMASGFGAGMGKSGCACGALAGAVMAISMKYGRGSTTEQREPSYSRASKAHDEFKRKFGATCCKIIRKAEFGTAEQKKRCAEIVKEATRIALGILKE